MYDRNEVNNIKQVVDRIDLESTPDQEIYRLDIVIPNILPEQETRYQKAAEHKEQIDTDPANIVSIIVEGLMPQYDQYNRNTT
jgi:lipopolysaccharide biosynthesis regulator YciM